jgi:hypothetical protein
VRDHQESALAERFLEPVRPIWAGPTGEGWTVVEWKDVRRAGLVALYEQACVQEVAAGTRGGGRWYRQLAFRAAPFAGRDPDALAPERAEVAEQTGWRAEEPRRALASAEDLLSMLLLTGEAVAAAVPEARQMLARAQREYKALMLHCMTAPLPRPRTRERAPSRPGRDTAYLPLWREVERVEEVGAERRRAEEMQPRARDGRTGAPGDDWGLE